MYCVISTTFTILDVIDLRCYVVLGLVPDLHVVSVILIVICRILSPFCRTGNRNSERLGKAPSPCTSYGLEPECQARSMQLQSTSVLHSAELASSFLWLHSAPQASLKVIGIYFKSVLYSISPCNGCHRTIYT